ncbi:hypothetical protein pb186bvf_010261 [Paramecium bursaria]
MGSCATKNADNEVTIPQNPRLQQFYKQYCQIINITHPLNVNIKYNNFFKILPEEFTGTGIKKTNCYESKLSYEEWQKKREESIQQESRIEGSAQNWAAIRQAVEADEQNAKAILNAVELRLVNQSIQILYDPQGQKYDVPIFCINKPVQFPNKKSFEQNLYMTFEKKQINFKGRCSKWQKDMDFTFNTQDKVQLIRDKISKEQKVRLFFSGREMHVHHQIGNYGVIEGAVIQVFL